MASCSAVQGAGLRRRTSNRFSPSVSFRSLCLPVPCLGAEVACLWGGTAPSMRHASRPVLQAAQSRRSCSPGSPGLAVVAVLAGSGAPTGSFVIGETPFAGSAGTGRDRGSPAAPRAACAWSKHPAVATFRTAGRSARGGSGSSSSSPSSAVAADDRLSEAVAGGDQNWFGSAPASSRLALATRQTRRSMSTPISVSALRRHARQWPLAVPLERGEQHRRDRRHTVQAPRTVGWSASSTIRAVKVSRAPPTA